MSFNSVSHAFSQRFWIKVYWHSFKCEAHIYSELWFKIVILIRRTHSSSQLDAHHAAMYYKASIRDYWAFARKAFSANEEPASHTLPVSSFFFRNHSKPAHPVYIISYHMRFSDFVITYPPPTPPHFPRSFPIPTKDARTARGRKIAISGPSAAQALCFLVRHLSLGLVYLFFGISLVIWRYVYTCARILYVCVCVCDHSFSDSKAALSMPVTSLVVVFLTFARVKPFSSLPSWSATLPFVAAATAAAAAARTCCCCSRSSASSFRCSMYSHLSRKMWFIWVCWEALNWLGVAWKIFCATVMTYSILSLNS